ncbi:MAG: undecaprenyldiphospho-muramoylpentapeptide beta-N-acetylglucosaminyltransferase, partial [Nitrospirota bacterium]|nr:undecaprenyldiphospho-muramoylpentapeptide beta-N-acetylglucosaminyltransferase [Nitrospirota bacterium]
DADILFVGVPWGIEAKVVPAEGFPLRCLKVKGLAGMGVGAKVKALSLLLPAVIEAKEIIREFRPDAVIGLGGYSSAPLLMAAVMKKIPSLVMEQNVVPGITNRLLGQVVRRVAVSFEASMAAFPAGRAVHTGNPVRSEMGTVERRAARTTLGLEPERFTLLVFGGSRGARSINAAMRQAAPMLAAMKDRLQIVHQTGSDISTKEVEEAYGAAGIRCMARTYIYQMAEAYAAADLVVCRSGASTVTELAVCGRASILVPYPFAAGNHQEFNARTLEEKGAARCILDAAISGGDLLAREITSLMDDDAGRHAMEVASLSLARKDATARVVDELERLA